MIGLSEAKWVQDNKKKEQEVAQSDVHDSVNISVTQSKISDFMA
jgi:hypothetical protein